ncbi:MAG: family 43 glycosylhydrolase [Eubacteriales bacterium]|nr:family 43 glycosylhydrolase [Eubacteriales bacterium]
MKILCNPININYRYQFNMDPRVGKLQIAREAADPSMIYYHGRYYIFASMTLGVWVSDDLVSWENRRLPENLPLYDYAPDVRIIGDYVYLSASKRGENCNFYRTQDILNGPYEEIEGSMSFWDPNLFCDDDGRVYFFWGCTNTDPLWGVELDPKTMKPLGEKMPMLYGDAWQRGYERSGENNSEAPLSSEAVEQMYQGFLQQRGVTEDQLSPDLVPMIKGMMSKEPFIEGAWLDKHQGKYYLQYACPGTQYNSYADGVFVSGNPLGPYKLAANKPYSYKPGGFLPGAGHGSTMWDKNGKLWHTATMRISMNHMFERRVGIWPAGFDTDGELFCNQRYGDWPMAMDDLKENPWADPRWYLLSYNKPVQASSEQEDHSASLAADENVQTWWRAATADSGEWLKLDLEEICQVNAVQINFADDLIEMEVPGEIRGETQARYIEERELVTRWILEGSLDDENYFVIEDKSDAKTDLTHDLIVREDGIKVRFLRLTVIEVPYEQAPCISGLRVFGLGNKQAPTAPEFSAFRTSDLDMVVTIEEDDAVGHNILWGHKADKLYHSFMTFASEQRVGALVAGQEYFVRVDSFNENGITEGKTVLLAKKA